MKNIRHLLYLFLILTLALPTAVLAQEDNPFTPFEDAGDQTINSFSISPSSAPIGTTVSFSGDYTVSNPGTDQIAFCFYFKTGDEVSWSSNFTALNSVAGINFTKYPSNNICDSIPNYGNFGFYATNTGGAAFGDTFNQDVTVPNVPSGTGTKIVGVRYYEGSDCDGSGGINDVPGGTNCSVVNQQSFNFTVQNPPDTVYAAADAAGCSGYDPCFTSLIEAYNAVNTGGTLYINDDMPAENLGIGKDLTVDSQTDGSVTGAAGNEVLQISGGSTVTVQNLTIKAGSATDVISLNNAGDFLTLKGCTLSGGADALTGSAGTLHAYANNITGFSNFGSNFGGTANLRHNWWGSSATQTSVNDSDAWTYRLGAAVQSWGEGSLGGASITAIDATGTGVIVSHGRGSDNAPFGKSTIEDGNTQCSDYYDFFTAPGATAGDWEVNVPIDSGSGCDYTYNNRQLFVFALSGGQPDTACSPIEACWDDIKDTVGENVIQLGRTVGLRWSRASTGQLGGTPLVAGNQEGNDPTLIQVQTLTATATRNTWLPLALVLTSLGLLGTLYYLQRRKKDLP
jgi:hypothetical protein